MDFNYVQFQLQENVHMQKTALQSRQNLFNHVQVHTIKVQF